MSSAALPAAPAPEGDLAAATASSSKDNDALSAPPAKPKSYFSQALGLFRASCVFGVLLGATATNVTVAMLIHAVTRDRKKAQGMCVLKVGWDSAIPFPFPFPYSLYALFLASSK